MNDGLVLTFDANFVNTSAMPRVMLQSETSERRAKILTVARWCFLNFGFSKTSFEDIAHRAQLSRTLLYRYFGSKEEIFQAVFADWLISRHPAAKQAADAPGRPDERLFEVCRLMVLQPWAEMAAAPMGHQFFDVCERVDPANEALYRQAMHECVTAILDDGATAEVFLLALDGLAGDGPAPERLEQRTRLLVSRFAGDPQHKDQEP